MGMTTVGESKRTSESDKMPVDNASETSVTGGIFSLSLSAALVEENLEIDDAFSFNWRPKIPAKRCMVIGLLTVFVV